MNPETAMNHPPYYVAVFGGFLVIEYYDGTPRDGQPMRICKTYTIADVRSATTWHTFEAADAAAKWAVTHLYPPDLRYFALLQVAA